MSEEIVGKVFKALEQPEGSLREWRRMSQEEPELAAMLEGHIDVLVRMLDAWGAHEPARATIEGACRTHAAALYAAWRMAMLKRWERESGIETA